MNEKREINEIFLKPYNANEHEDSVYKIWEKSNIFSPEKCIEKGYTDKDAPKFSMVLPPPNVTGVLHMGSAFMLVTEDTLIRFNRMKGKKTLWIPGMDHAAIATQSRVEKELLKKEKKRKEDLGREAFIERVQSFAEDNRVRMREQIKKIGSSVDWDREAFTLDEPRAKAVRYAFAQMYKDGLIYRGEKVVNWDPKGQTTLSDDEIEYQEGKAKLYTFRYSKDFPIPVATTRPETKVGDTAVAVNPNDKRYKKYIGQTFEINFVGIPLSIKVVSDREIDPEFGTGAVGVTPAHSKVDEQIAKRNKLPSIKVINEYAKMDIDDEELRGKKTLQAREIIVERLKKAGLMEKEEEVEQNLSVSYRSGGTIEPLPKEQWFIDVNKKFKIPHSNIDGIENGELVSLKELILHAVKNKQINIVPERFEKVYFNWIEKLEDWCISRQIWYGHRIPVWYKDKAVYCDTVPPKEEGWEQDPDTLDTWFSSALWTFSTLGWPDNLKINKDGTLEKTGDLLHYHPTDVLETGYDILFFWVARMILMSTYHLGEIPFKTVYMHGMVRDGEGRKLSKSLGNNIDPLDVAEKYGTDAVRMALLVGTAPGNDTKVSEQKLKAYKHFSNKIWNVTRFVLENTSTDSVDEIFIKEKEQKHLDEWKKIAKEITTDLEKYRIHLASEKLYNYFWHRLADILIEESKSTLLNGDEDDKKSVATLLNIILKENLIMLHPFMPFITEAIWQITYVENKKPLAVERWPIK